MADYAERSTLALELGGYKRPVTRGTTNKNVSGNSEDRRRRKVWLVAEFRADVDLWLHPIRDEYVPVARGLGLMACRCYRCGTLLHVGTVFVDRRVPGALGGTYARHNIRPNCSTCSARTGTEVKARKQGKS